MQVEVEIDLNAAANARNLYANRKANLVKQQKTLDANEKAFKAAEKRAAQQLSKVLRRVLKAQHNLLVIHVRFIRSLYADRWMVLLFKHAIRTLIS